MKKTDCHTDHFPAHIERMRLRTRHRTILETERTGSSHRIRSDTHRS